MPEPESPQPAKSPASTAAKPAAPAKPASPAKPAARPAAKPKPPAPKAGEASPRQKRPGVIYGAIKPLSLRSIVVPFTHTVEAGETMESIARSYYGDRKRATELRTANDLPADGQPALGQEIKIPKG